MKSRTLFFAFLAVSAVAPVLSGCGSAQAQSAANPLGRDVRLVLYAGDAGQISETRPISLAGGSSRLELPEISEQLDQSTLQFTGKDKPEVLSVIADLGLDDQTSLLKRYVGKPIDVVYRAENGREGDRIKGILEVAEPGNVVVRAKDKYLINPIASLEAPAEAGVAPRASLAVELDPKGPKPKAITFSYLTTGLGWSTDYVATLGEETMSLEAWATVQNQTGIDYPEAKLTFMAGSPNINLQPRRRSQMPYPAAAMPMDAAKSMVTESQFSAPVAVGEMFAYQFESTATIRHNQTNRVRLMSSETVKIQRDLTITLPMMTVDYAALRRDQRLSARQVIRAVNQQSSGLGLPLPAGPVRVFAAAEKGDSPFIGSSFINNTPKDASIQLAIASSFDVYGTGRIVRSVVTGKRKVEREVELVVHNEKAKAQEVQVAQTFGDSWRILSESSPSRRAEANGASWRLSVPAGDKVILRFRVALG